MKDSKNDLSNTGSNASSLFLSDEEEEFRQLAASPDVYEKIAKSIAPSIYGSQDIKKSIACLLFGGSRKRSVVKGRVIFCWIRDLALF